MVRFLASIDAIKCMLLSNKRINVSFLLSHFCLLTWYCN